MKVCPKCQRCYDDGVEECAAHHGPLSESRPGDVSMIAGYRFEEVLYSGLRGDLFRATRTDCGRTCTIRLVTGDSESATLFHAEAKLLKNLYHPNFAAVYESGVTDRNELFIVCEDTEQGNTLRVRLDRLGPPNLLESIHITRIAAEAVHALHESGVVHRALNPDNILITTDHHGKVHLRLQNFDIGGVSQRSIISNRFLIDTETDYIKYFAPEQCSGDPATPRSDVYSLGILLYELIAGSPPFDGDRASEVMEQHRHCRPSELTIDNFDLRMLVSHSLMEALGKRIDLRQASADLFARQLKHIELLATHVSTPPPAVIAVTPPAAETRVPRMITIAEVDVDVPDLHDATNANEETDELHQQPASVSVTSDDIDPRNGADLKAIDPASIKQIDFRVARDQMEHLLDAPPVSMTRQDQCEPKLVHWDGPLDDIPSVEETLEHLRADGAEAVYVTDVDDGELTRPIDLDEEIWADHNESSNAERSDEIAVAGAIDLGLADGLLAMEDSVEIHRMPEQSEAAENEMLFSSLGTFSQVRFVRLRRGVGIGAVVGVLALAFAFRSDIVDAFTPFDLDSTDPSRLRITTLNHSIQAQKMTEPELAAADEQPQMTMADEEVSTTADETSGENQPVVSAASMLPNTRPERTAEHRDDRMSSSEGSAKTSRPKAVPQPITPSTIVITYTDPKKREALERDPFVQPRSSAGMTRPRIVANPKP